MITLQQTIDRIKEININEDYNIYFKSHCGKVHIIIEENKFKIIGGKQN